MIRKITPKGDEEKRKKRNQILVSVILASIMILSTLVYSFGTNLGENSKTKLKYNNYDFEYFNGLWNTNISGEIFGFASTPFNSYNVTSDINSLESYYGKPLYLFSENTDAENEIYRNLYKTASEISPACPENEKGCNENIPVKNCSDNFIIIKEGNSSGVYQKENCAFIFGAYENLTKITDGFLLKIIGVQ